MNACPFCHAPTRLLQKRGFEGAVWYVQCGGFGCLDGFTGNHTTPLGAEAEWKAIVANPAKYQTKQQTPARTAEHAPPNRGPNDE